MEQRLKKIDLSPVSVAILASTFNVDKEFVVAALELTELPELDEKSSAETVEEAEAEHLEAENCCDDIERAAFRRWIELTDDISDIMEIFIRISCEDGDSEKMLAIRKMAVIMKLV